MLELHTQRLVLKSGNFEDYKKVFEYNFKLLRNTNGICKLQKNDNEMSLKILEILYNRPKNEKDFFEFIIFLKDPLTPIGHVIADRKNDEFNSLELGYDLHPLYWNQGFMTEAVTIFLKYLFEIGYENVFSGYAEGNYRSKKILNKLGFKYFEESDLIIDVDKNTVVQYHMILSKDEFLKRKELMLHERNEFRFK